MKNVLDNIALYIMMLNKKRKEKNMKLKKNYLTFLGVCILAVLGLWIYGFLFQTPKQNDLPQNNSLTSQENQELDEVFKYLEELKHNNEIQIEEQRKTLQQIQHLDQQIKLNI